MFGNLKEKIISASKNVKLFLDAKETAPAVNYTVNLNAGAHILNHFQEQWEQLHELNEENAQKSETLAGLIIDMYTKMNEDYRNVCDVSHVLSTGTNSLYKSVEICKTQLEEIATTFETVENGLLHLEDLIENLELQERQLEHRFQLAMYKEKKLANLEALRAGLAEKHTQSVTEYETKQKQVLVERQLAFQEAFQTDMEFYKQAGQLPKIRMKPAEWEEEQHAGPLLEEILLDCDNKDLDTFLSDE